MGTLVATAMAVKKARRASRDFFMLLNEKVCVSLQVSPWLFMMT